MSKHLSWKLVALAVVLGWTASAHASVTRLQSMGANPAGLGIGKTGQFVEGMIAIDDSTNIFALPGTLIFYPSLATMDNVTWSDTDGASGMFGFHYALGEYTVFALYGGTGTNSIAQTESTTAGENSNAITAAKGVVGDGSLPVEEGSNAPHLDGEMWFGALFAHDVGGVRLGAGLHMFSANNQMTLPAEVAGESSNWAVDVDLGLGLDFETEDSLDFGLGIRYGDFAYKGPVPGGTAEPANYFTAETHFGFDFTGRGKFLLYEGTELIPYGQLAYEAEGVNNRAVVGGNRGDSSHVGIELGSNLKIMPGDNIAIYAGAGFRTDTYTVVDRFQTIDDDLRLTLPFYGFSVDARVWKWFAFRMGARQYVMSDTDGSINGAVENSTTKRVIDTNLNVGFGLFFGANDEWRVDADLSPAFFVKGPYLLSGTSTTTAGGAEQMNASIAVQYLW